MHRQVKRRFDFIEKCGIKNHIVFPAVVQLFHAPIVQCF